MARPEKKYRRRASSRVAEATGAVAEREGGA
jgi:hypothetical protein